MASIHARTNADGSLSFQVRWLADGRQRSRSFKVASPGPRARAAAEREAAAFARQVERGEAAPDGAGMTVDALLDRWLAAKAPRVEPSSIYKYQQIVRDVVRPAFGRLALGRVTPLLVERWLAEQRATGIAADTLASRWGVLVSVLRQAVRWRLIAWNPTDGVEAPRKGDGRTRALSEAEVAALLAACVAPLDRALVALLCFTGCRIGEALALRWTDLDLEGGAVRFAATTQTTAAGVAVRQATKTGDARTVGLDGATVEALRALRRERLALRERLRLPAEVGGYVFTLRADGARPGATAIGKRVRTAAARAQLVDVTPHVLRHSAATVLERQGVPASVIAAILGHARTSTTRRYQHPDLADQRAALARVRRAVDGQFEADSRTNIPADVPAATGTGPKTR